jgi:uncharacterized membrane protein YkoI
MKRLIATILLILAAPAAVPLAFADPAHDQGEVRKERKAGNVQSLREIERRVLPTMPGMQYLGPEYDPIAMAYRLKFIGKGRLWYVDVDARSGKVISTSR